MLMANPMPTSGQPSEVSARLHAVAVLLRQGHHLGPETRQELAEVVDELSRALDHTPLPTGEAAHLAESAGHLAEALKQQHDATLLGSARDRLLQAAVAAENNAPVAAGLIRQIADALSEIGI
jgi:Domain of unknown function (DUF4404)